MYIHTYRSKHACIRQQRSVLYAYIHTYERTYIHTDQSTVVTARIRQQRSVLYAYIHTNVHTYIQIKARLSLRAYDNKDQYYEDVILTFDNAIGFHSSRVPHADESIAQDAAELKVMYVCVCVCMYVCVCVYVCMYV